MDRLVDKSLVKIRMWEISEGEALSFEEVCG